MKTWGQNVDRNNKYQCPIMSSELVKSCWYLQWMYHHSEPPCSLSVYSHSVMMLHGLVQVPLVYTSERYHKERENDFHQYVPK